MYLSSIAFAILLLPVMAMIRMAQESLDAGWALIKMNGGLSYTGGSLTTATFEVDGFVGEYFVKVCTIPASVGFRNVTGDNIPLAGTPSSNTYTYYRNSLRTYLRLDLPQAGANICIPRVQVHIYII